MPIRVPDELPAVNFLREENVFVMTTSRASGQEIRPLKVLILNLMPKKIETENVDVESTPEVDIEAIKKATIEELHFLGFSKELSEKLLKSLNE